MATTLNHHANAATGPRIAEYLRKRAQVLDSQGNEHRRQCAEVRSLAAHLDSRKPTDERIYILSRAAPPDMDGLYKPGPQQRRLIDSLGAKVTAVEPDVALSELASCAVDDALASVEEARGERNKVTVELEESEQRERVADHAAETARAESRRLEAEAEANRERIGELEILVEHLQSGNGSKDRVRRKNVEGQPHLYWTETGDGDVKYEVSYRQLGKQKWKVIGPDYDEAVKARDELHAEVAA